MIKLFIGLAFVLILVLIGLNDSFMVYAQGSIDNIAENVNLQLTPNTFSFYQNVALSFVIAFVTVFSITLGVNNWFENKDYIRKSKSKFWYIIRDSDCFPSLALFQFTLWTFTISFSYLSIYLSRLLNGASGLGELDANILILLGLSVSVPIISKAISNIKYFVSCPDQLPAYSTMLEENGKISLTRFQYFLWTWVSIVIFFVTLFYNVSQLTPDNIDKFSLPEIHETLIYLMGLSQAGYLGVKFVTKSPSFIKKLLVSLNPNHKRDVWTILGNGFGNNPEKVIITKLSQAESQTIEYGRETIDEWTDKRISLYPYGKNTTDIIKSKSQVNVGDKLVIEILVGSKITKSVFIFNGEIFEQEETK